MSNSNDRETSIGESSGNSKRETRVASNAGSNGPTRNEGDSRRSSETSSSQEDDRRIVGIMITYSCSGKRAGVLKEVRLGKNYIGRDKVGRAPGDPNCDIRIPDPKMSSSHALILCRELREGGEVKFDLIDLESSNGTYLNGKLVGLTGETLIDDYAKIKTGDTVWTFIKIDRQSSELSEGDSI